MCTIRRMYVCYTSVSVNIRLNEGMKMNLCKIRKTALKTLRNRGTYWDNLCIWAKFCETIEENRNEMIEAAQNHKFLRNANVSVKRNCRFNCQERA